MNMPERQDEVHDRKGVVSRIVEDTNPSWEDVGLEELPVSHVVNFTTL